MLRLLENSDVESESDFTDGEEDFVPETSEDEDEDIVN